MQILFYDHVGLDIFALDDDLVIEIKPLLGAFGLLCDIVCIALIYPLYRLELDDRSAQTVYSPLPVLALMQSLLGDAYAGICAFYDIFSTLARTLSDVIYGKDSPAYDIFSS